MRDNKTPPVEVNQIVETIVYGFGKSGDAILKIDGYVVFLKLEEGITQELKTGDSVRIKMTKVLPKFGFSELVADEGD